jgi:hypothetical protein
MTPETKFSRYAQAHTAATRAANGEFVCMGRILQPLSLFHDELLQECLGDSYIFLEELEDFALLEVATKICSSTFPDLDIGVPETELELVQFADKCGKLDLEKEAERFAEYVRACMGSSPRLVKFGGDGTNIKELRAPFAHIVISQLLTTCTTGVSFDELLYRWPVGKVMWLYWSLRELKDERTRIAPTDEPVVMTEEEKAEEDRITTLVGKAFARRYEKAKGIVDPSILKTLDDETSEIIRKIQTGELTEVAP